MRYLLVVGFHCEVYKREPRARIFVGDRLIDEFLIPHSPADDSIISLNQLFFKNLHPLQPWYPKEIINGKYFLFPPLKLYELEIERQQEQLKLLIDIENTDSNYTNGFITKSTLINLKIFYFFPLDKKILLRLEKIRKNQLLKNYTAVYKWTNNIFDIMSTGIKWHGKNKQVVADKEDQAISGHKLGGSGYFSCELTKKYGIFIKKLKKVHRYKLQKSFINYFLDKYKEYENQRNNN